MNEVAATAGYFVSRLDGKKILFRAARRESGKAVLILHGACEHSGRYLHLTKFLGEQGYSVFAPDLRGHGRSEGRPVHVERFSDYLSDLDQMLNWIREPGCLRVHLLGHSMGGLIVARYVQEYQPDITSLILSSPLFGWKKMPRIKIFVGKVISRIWPTFSFKNPVDETALSHDESVVREYRQDPLAYNVGTARFGAELTKNFAILFEKAKTIRAPLLLLAGGADQITDLKASREFFEKVGSRDKECYIFEEMYHEIFNETEKENPLGRLADWLRKLDG
ncbi:lysophospholipase [Candidatus Hakubella thermalkaliphila]|uniref:Lysophospholipase n=2 Tax=Candidatus Hakubella thermalkaliphila TaxID=2754717 RepID=A0A6V8NJ99_9ACTN|nr:alpha/beta hydrolase [Candidatus Hakubella thermalkaliphila]GFP18596.1 lysophospholipase [Candidatus Hakubella thermalkaliphila]GFP29206.1 lysophospholipase [Candidatus Hakubella thermalkaliphila]GFP36652.1 lysophospholipase [Candidatus Hakubella thermalkaliphila]GFP42267.1 lysophospholipase [Candidatus Hakubella thermalkaliphila]